MSARAAYHHGDLRRALLDAAAELITEQGVTPLSLRELARRAGVSHAAPAHHFTDKAGLFTALAIEGYRKLGAAFTADHTRGVAQKEGAGHGIEPSTPERASGENTSGETGPQQPDPRLLLRELGVRYVRFALEHPAHFDVMYRPDLHRTDAEELMAARTRTRELLHAAVPGGPDGPHTRQYAVAAWSAAHGFATLWRSGSLEATTGGGAPEDEFRLMSSPMFGSPAPIDDER